MDKEHKLPDFTKLIDLAARKIGGETLLCSDDFFASMENLINPGRGIFIKDKYTENGKWMDGWESRRKRIPGNDWCIIKLGAAGIIRGLDIDTNHFLGNHPPYCSIEVCNYYGNNLNKAEWVEILPKSSLESGSQNFYEVINKNTWTHVKLHIYPDGGVARLRVYGEVQKDWSQIAIGEEVDLAYAVNGAKSVLCNDMFFSHMDNLLMPGRGENMGDGWETKRNRTPNNKDWVIIKLAHRGRIKRIDIDTCNFKGNYPDSCLIEGCNYFEENTQDNNWEVILPQTKLQADYEHFYKSEIVTKEAFTHIRLSIFPDGGVSRLRLWGTITE